MRIFINAGHGGNDPGACGNGLIERDVALNIGQLVEHYLKAVGYDVKLFQYDGLQTICDTANNWNADLFISIHCNAGGGTGTETYYFKGSANGETLAALVETAFIDNSIDANLLRHKQDDFARAIARGVSDFYAFPKPDVIDLPCHH